MNEFTSLVVAYAVVAALLWGYAALLLAQRMRRR